MTVIVTARSETLVQGIRRFDARRDLRQVADLIATVFANELDANGRTALQEMETIGRWSPVLGTLLSTAFFADFVAGYVWLEEGRVVGNVTLQRQEESGTRWRISNVAVAEQYRGRGIARWLMLATLREIAQRGGSWAILQVRVDNAPARRLYERLGFSSVCQEGVWYAAHLPASMPAVGPGIVLRPLGSRDWRACFELAQAARPALAQWADPIYADAYRPGLWTELRTLVGQLTGLQRVRRWGLWAGDPAGDYLFGEVEVALHWGSGPDRLILTIRPSAPPGTAAALLARGVDALRGASGRGVLVEYDGDLPETAQALELAGFRPRRILLSMRRLITPADADTAIPGLD